MTPTLLGRDHSTDWRNLESFERVANEAVLDVALSVVGQSQGLSLGEPRVVLCEVDFHIVLTQFKHCRLHIPSHYELEGVEVVDRVFHALSDLVHRLAMQDYLEISCIHRVYQLRSAARQLELFVLNQDVHRNSLAQLVQHLKGP